MRAETPIRLPAALVHRFQENVLLLSQINQTRASYVSLLSGHDPNDGLSRWARVELERLNAVSQRHLDACLGLLQQAAEQQF